MQLPEGTRFAYIVSHEAYYWDAIRTHRADQRPEIIVQASAVDGGVAWEFTVTDTNVGSPKLTMFGDSWAAFDQIFEFFSALAALGETPTLAQVREVLDRLGAVDQTERAQPVR